MPFTCMELLTKYINGASQLAHIYIRIYTVTPTSLGKAVNPWACAVATPSAPQTSTRRGFRTLRSTPKHNPNPN